MTQFPGYRGLLIPLIDGAIYHAQTSIDHLGKAAHSRGCHRILDITSSLGALDDVQEQTHYCNDASSAQSRRNLICLLSTHRWRCSYYKVYSSWFSLRIRIRFSIRFRSSSVAPLCKAPYLKTSISKLTSHEYCQYAWSELITDGS